MNKLEDLYGPLDEKKKKRKKKKRKGGKKDGKGSSKKGYTLRDWFKGDGWVQTGGKYDGKPCAKQPGQKTKPYCRDPDDRAKMSKKERDRRAAKKRREDPNPERRGKAKNVRQKKTKRKSKKNEVLYMDLEQIVKEELQNILEATEADYRRSMGGYINTPDSPRAEPTGMSSDDKNDFMLSVSNQVKQKLEAIDSEWILEDESFGIEAAMGDMSFTTKEKYVEGIKNALNSLPDWTGYSGLGDQIFNDVQLEHIIKEELEKIINEGIGTGALIGGALMAAAMSGDNSSPKEVVKDTMSDEEKKRIAAELVKKIQQDQGFQELADQWEAADNLKRNKPAAATTTSMADLRKMRADRSKLEEIVNEELEAVLDEKRKKKKKKKKKKKAKRDACYHKVKSRYKVWPSAYASGALVKCRRVGAKNWGNSTKESLEIEVQNEIELILQERTLKEQEKDVNTLEAKRLVGELGADVLLKLDDKDDGSFDAAIEKAIMDYADFDQVRDQILTMIGAEVEVRGTSGADILRQIRGGLEEKKEADLRTQIISVLKKEGGAAGMKDLKDQTGGSEEEITKEIDAADNIKVSEHGDVILVDGLEEAGCGDHDDDENKKTLSITIKEELEAVLDEKRKKKKKKKKSAKDRMKCNSSRRIRKGEPGYGKKKFVVKACEGGTEKIIRYGDANMEIKKDSPARRKSFRARHNCKNPGSKLKARYWSCKKW